jgi:hypothetical protein
MLEVLFDLTSLPCFARVTNGVLQPRTAWLNFLSSFQHSSSFHFDPSETTNKKFTFLLSRTQEKRGGL